MIGEGLLDWRLGSSLLAAIFLGRRAAAKLAASSSPSRQFWTEAVAELLRILAGLLVAGFGAPVASTWCVMRLPARALARVALG
eukprot:1549478-Pyramimonas_sp.AAC.1